MEQRKLGRSSLNVAPLAFGGAVFGWTADESTSFALLDAFVDAGFNLIDTANNYSAWIHNGVGGQSETIIGKWLSRSGKRDRVVLATKVGGDMGADGRGLSKQHILRALEGSLKRLQTDHVDLYQAHFDDEATHQGETLSAFNDLIAQGKVRAIGASNFSATRLRSALDTSSGLMFPRYNSLQPEYNLHDRDGFERELQQLCLDEEVGVIPYFALGNGFLTGKYRSLEDTSSVPREGLLKKYFTPRGMRILTALEHVATDLEATSAQVALAWLIARSGITAPIVSATSVKQLIDLTGGARLHLDASAMAVLDDASALEPIHFRK